MNTKQKILIGVTINGVGGIDRYVTSFVKIANENNIVCHVLTTKFDSSFEQELKKHNAKLIEISNLKNKREINKKIINLHKENNYHAAYWNISTAIMYPYIKASVDCKIPNIAVHSHAHYNSQSNTLKLFVFDKLHYYYRQKLQKLPVNYAACAKECARWIAGDKVVADNNWLFIPNPIDTEKCKFNKQTRKEKRQQLGVDSKIVFGCTTSFYPYKNPLFLIKVFSEIYKINNNTHLLIAGDGPMRKEVKGLAKSLLPNNSYNLLGLRKDVSELIQAFDCFLLPSLNEGLPLCVLEAQAADLPVLMSTNITEESIVLKNKLMRLDFKEGTNKWANTAIDLTKEFKNRSDTSAEKVSLAGFNLNSPKKALSILGF